MKTTMLLLMAGASALAIGGVPTAWQLTNPALAGCEARATGAPVDCDTLSSRACRLRIEAGPNTHVDRGLLTRLAPRQELTGAFRYVQELEHRALYVYDEVQNLVGRVIDPERVFLVNCGP